MLGSKLLDLVRQCFDTYVSANRQEIEALLAPNFTFTSPYDDHIDRATYFDRCWPLAGSFLGHDLQEVVTDGDACFVLYEATARNGARFRNTELFRVEDGRIRSIEVFFGLPPNGEPTNPEQAVRALVEHQLRAIRAKDVDAMLSHYAPDMVSFDAIGPLRTNGLPGVRAQVEQWFAAYAGPIETEVRDLRVTASDGVAFCSGLQQVRGTLTNGTAVAMWVRLTLGLRNVEGTWRIVHEHVSDPFDATDGKALTGLVP